MSKFFNGTGENSNSNTYFQNYNNEPNEESTFVGVGETVQNNNDSFANNFENMANNNGGTTNSFVSADENYYADSNNFVSQDQVTNENTYTEEPIKYYDQSSQANYQTYQNDYNNETEYIEEPQYVEQPQYAEQYQEYQEQPQYAEQYQEYQEQPQYEGNYQEAQYQDNSEYESLETNLLDQNKQAYEQYYNGNEEVENEVIEEEKKPTTEEALNSMFVPLDTEEKDIIKNPVYIEAMPEKDREVSGNPVACLWILIESLLIPATSIKKNTEKYVNGNKTIKVYITLMIFYLILYYVGHIISGCFTIQFAAVKGDFIYVLDFSNLAKINYLSMIINSIIFTIAITLILAIINYATSFFNNKGQPFFTYLLMCTLSYFPLLLYINTLFPIIRIFSLYISIIGLFLTFIYSLFIYGVNIKNIMEFKNENRYIRYVMLNYIVTVILVFTLLYLLKNDMVSQIMNTINSL